MDGMQLARQTMRVLVKQTVPQIYSLAIMPGSAKGAVGELVGRSGNKLALIARSRQVQFAWLALTLPISNRGRAVGLRPTISSSVIWS